MSMSTKNKTLKIKKYKNQTRKFPTRIRLYSTPRIAQKMAY